MNLILMIFRTSNLQQRDRGDTAADYIFLQLPQDLLHHKDTLIISIWSIRRMTTMTLMMRTYREPWKKACSPKLLGRPESLSFLVYSWCADVLKSVNLPLACHKVELCLVYLYHFHSSQGIIQWCDSHSGWDGINSEKPDCRGKPTNSDSKKTIAWAYLESNFFASIFIWEETAC